MWLEVVFKSLSTLVIFVLWDFFLKRKARRSPYKARLKPILLFQQYSAASVQPRSLVGLLSAAY
jgi:hypothetical protein